MAMAALVATSVAASGERRVPGLEVAAGNDEASAWPAFDPNALRARTATLTATAMDCGRLQWTE